VKPDRWEEFVEQARKVKSIFERHGGKNIRLLAGLVAGQQTGAIVGTVEFDDMSAYGAFEDKVLADPEMPPMMSGNDANPVAGPQTSIFLDVPL